MGGDATWALPTPMSPKPRARRDLFLTMPSCRLDRDGPEDTPAAARRWCSPDFELPRSNRAVAIIRLRRFHNVVLGRTISESGTTITMTGSLRIDGLAAFADPTSAAIGATCMPKRSPLRVSPAKLSASRTARTRQDSATAGTEGKVRVVDVPLDGRNSISRARDDHGRKIFGVASSRSVWVVVRLGRTIFWVARQQTAGPSPQPRP